MNFLLDATHMVGRLLIGLSILATVYWLLTRGWRRRIRVAREKYQRDENDITAGLATLGDAGKGVILDTIDRYSRDGAFQTYYVPVTSQTAANSQTGVSAARIGGYPLALPGEPWPARRSGDPAIFLLQVTLESPRLPEQWRGRHLTLFLRDGELYARSYSREECRSLCELVVTNIGKNLLARRELRAVATPYFTRVWDDEKEEFTEPTMPEYLLENIPGLAEQLGPVRIPEKVLGAALATEAHWPLGMSENVIQAGGDPLFVQGGGDIPCPQCGKLMRFLFQFPDVSGKRWLLGDCGSGYVFGCDTHPDQCLGLTECY